MRDQDSIVLRISRSYPIELDKLTFGMMSLGAEYERFVRKEHPDAQDHEADLLVNKITEGSIVIELFGAVQPLFQGMNNILIFKQFVEMLGAKLSLLSMPDGRLDDATSRELKDIARFVETVVGDKGGVAELGAVEYVSKTEQRKVAARFSFQGTDAERVIENAEAQVREITGSEPNRENGVLMRLFQTNIGAAAPDRASGEKGIIESLSEHPRRLIYASDLAGQRIKGAWSDQGKSPYELGFTVDVDVQMVNGKPRAYRILDVHDIFPLDEADD